MDQEKLYAIVERAEFFYPKSFHVNKNSEMMSLKVESKYFSWVDLKAFPILRNRRNFYLEKFELRYHYYKPKKCMRKLYLNLSLMQTILR